MAETRRSSRLAAQPKKEEVPVPARKPSKKRSTGDAPGPAAKKAKASDQPEENVEPSAGDAKVASPDAEEAKDVKPVDIGDALPSLTLKNEKGEDIEVSTLAAEKGVILFLIPKADTPGCTTQACGFRDSYPSFTEHGYDVYCLSADSPSAQTKWQTKKELPYPLLSDPKRVLITALGAGEGGKTKRSHFIFEKGGKLVEKKIPVKPAESPALALKFIKSQGETEESQDAADKMDVEKLEAAEETAE
ncbi:hypothetical protein PHLGIDRAFT_126396 [Phlebiopsis gigantea 11061_1 CR5-6]|uniref:thioredoxin-dependent peroxiredoxin n=1 Tax=Phlebiopsis gigantea (strain 11061_1 CR5-6) TaxID=745531 RepID=A0A0C3S2C2_PHLG1|nr:hypothetical protein PHLGIDRAFT_126396 [Phlebiopsis gigantea 11061_1 CR5-6]